MGLYSLESAIITENPISLCLYFNDTLTIYIYIYDLSQAIVLENGDTSMVVSDF